MTIYGLFNAFSVLEEVGLLVRVFFTWVPFSILLFVIVLRIFNDKDWGGGDPLFFFTASLLALLATFYWINEPYFLWILPFIFMSMIDEVGVDRRICWVLVILHLFYILEHIGVKYFITGGYSKYLPIGGSFSTALGATFGLFIWVGTFDLITKGQCSNYLKDFRDYLSRTGSFFISKLHLSRDKISLAKTISLILFFNIFLIGIVYIPYSGLKFFKISGTSYAPFTAKDPILALIVIFLNFFIFLPMVFSYVVSSPDYDDYLPRYFAFFMLIFYLLMVPVTYFILSVFY